MSTTAADTTDPGATGADEAKSTADFLDAVREVLTRPRPSPAERQKVRDQDRLLHDTYPGEYVAYRDIWDGRTFVRREVLAHSPDLKDYFAQLGGYSDADKGDIRVTYCEPLELRGKIILRQRLVLPDAPE
ncbi:MAG: hypothetical protein K2X82_21395 [Gemmataceae bacterium]|nr:hypothetical protein [Gemmataceae bacterium]